MRVGFFDKEKCKRCPGQKLVRESPDNIEKISMLLTEAFSEISFRVYIRSYDASKESLLPTLLEQAFNNFWQEEKTVIELNQVSAKILDGFDVKTTIISQEFNQELPPLAEEEERIAQIAEEACP